MKKTIITIIMMFLIIGIFASSTNAATTSIGASFNKSEQTVSVTVSFSEKVSAAQFVLNYDSNKVTYVSNSAGGQFGESAKRFAYASANPNLKSVTFTFKSRTTGNCSFSIGGLKVKTAQGITTPTLSNSSTSVNMQPNTSSSTTSQQPQTPSASQPTTSSSKPNTSQSTSKSTTNKKKTTKKTTTKNQTTTVNGANQEQTAEEQVPEQEEIEDEDESEEQLIEDETGKEQNNNTQEENTVNENKIETEIEDKLNSVTRINMVFRIVIMVLVVVIVMFIIAFIIKKK